MPPVSTTLAPALKMSLIVLGVGVGALFLSLNPWLPSVPEPSNSYLLGAGLAALVGGALVSFFYGVGGLDQEGRRWQSALALMIDVTMLVAGAMLLSF